MWRTFTIASILCVLSTLASRVIFARPIERVGPLSSVSAPLSSADGAKNPLVSYPVISGIGVALTITPAGPQIFKVMPGSVAATSEKLHHGDLIIAVKSGDRFTSLKGMAMGEVTNLIRGPVGTRIALRVQSRDDKISTVVLTRKSIPLPVPSYQGLIGKGAPNTSFVSLEQSRPIRLADYKGRIVFLDLWAPWCGTCYAPLNELQRIASTHPAWKGRVVFLAASVHSSRRADLRAIRQQGWNAITFLSVSLSNMKAMGIEVVPTLLVVDPSGKITAVGDPHAMSIESIAFDLLARSRPG